MNPIAADPTLLLPLAVFAPAVAAFVVLALGARAGGRTAGWLVFASALASVAALTASISDAASALTFTLPWMPAIGVELALRADAFGVFLALLVAGIGALVALYAISYLAHEEAARLRRFFAALAVFMSAMLGVALADDLMLLFVFWELTSISSFLLIGYRYRDDDAKAGALMALQVTALGGLVMSVGFLLVGQIAGTFRLSVLASDLSLINRLHASPLATPALLAILVGAFTKSAQIPFHFWLPRAMVAPTPVSAYLHAATMVKAGVFLLGRMLPIFAYSPLWAPTLLVVGGATMLLNAIWAFGETDLKAILARTTGATLGMITLLYGMSAAEQDALQILSHALYKGSLFLVAGIVEHTAHTRDLRRLGGLRRELPMACLACVLAALSMAGVPPLLGFLAKESFYAELLHERIVLADPAVRALVVVAVVVANAFIAAVAAKLVIGIFFGAPARAGARRHAAPERHEQHAERPPLWISPLVLAVAALALGGLGLTTFTAELASVASSTARAELHLSLVPPLGLPLFLSAVTLGLGALLYAQRARFDRLRERVRLPLPGADDVWQRLVAGSAAAGDWFSRNWQNGSARWYLGGTLAALPVLVWYSLSAVDLSYADIVIGLAELPWYGSIFCVLLAAATLIAVRATSRLQAAIAQTTIGFLVAMLYVVYRSPDILLTQILIETVSTIFILLVLVFLPPFPPQDLPRSGRMWNFAVASAFALAIAVLLLLAMTPGLRETDNIATRPGGLLSLALREGGGANAVNVIIVDIRAMDTTGEVTVLVAVGLCIYGLLRSRRRAA